MRPDESREQMTKRIDALATLIEDALPKQVPNEPRPDWPQVGALLLARIAGQARTISVLMGSHRELDARMITRSLFEHVALFCWLAIDADDPSEPWEGLTPEDNTKRWIADQLRRAQRSTEHQHVELGLELDEDTREGIREAKRWCKELGDRGRFPSVVSLAAEADRRWGGKLSGWPKASAVGPGSNTTLRALYWSGVHSRE